MSLRKELTNEELEKVAGGLDINNDWGNGSYYKVSRTGENNFEYYFKASDMETYNSIEQEVGEAASKTVMTQTQIDDLFLEKLNNSGILKKF